MMESYGIATVIENKINTLTSKGTLEKEIQDTLNNSISYED